MKSFLNLVFVFFLLLLGAYPAFAQPVPEQYYFYNKPQLQNAREAYRQNKINDETAVKHLFAEADQLLNAPLLSVINKELTPPSGDKHDYYSLAPYWWPDTSVAGGKPYIRKDGKVNPERYKVPDDKWLNEMCNAVKKLALAYYLSGKERYAKKALAFIKTWFIDPSTKMNPNLNYAQIVKGRGLGRSYGIIDARSLAYIPDAIHMLDGYQQLTTEDISTLKNWFADYYHWLKTSKQGREEASNKNNHLTWYLMQALPLADFAGQKDDVKTLLERSRHDILNEVVADGAQPRELARTKAMSYSLFNISAMEQLFTVCENLNEDNWHYTSPGGQSLKKCLDFLMPYLSKEKDWTYQQIAKVSDEEIYQDYLKAAVVYQDKAYWELVKQYQHDRESQLIDNIVLDYFPENNN